jgi:hypothetical protein
MPASGLKTSKKSKQTPKSSIVKSPIAKQPSKSPAAQSQALPKAKAKVAHQSTSADDFLLNSDRVTVDEVQPEIGEAAARKPKSRKVPDSPRAVVYIGRLPHGFFEDQLKVSVRSFLPLLLYSLQSLSSFFLSSSCTCLTYCIALTDSLSARHFWDNSERFFTSR